jgi:hypothetical protein
MAGPVCGAPDRPPMNVTACPLARSRNALLSEADRVKALSISQSLRVRTFGGFPCASADVAHGGCPGALPCDICIGSG